MTLKPLTRAAALGLALAGLAVPVANAQPQDLRSPDARDAAPAVRPPQDLRGPDARDAATLVQTSQDLRSPDSRDAAAGRGAFNTPEVMVVKLPQPSAAPVVAGGIDWADAGIGAGGLLAVLALGLGGAFAIVHRKHGHPTATAG